MSDAIGEVRTSGKAIWSLVLGIGSFFCSLFAAIPAIVLGVLALNDIARGGGRLSGRGMAITGIVLGSVVSVLAAIGMALLLLLPAVQAARTAGRRAESANQL